MRAGSAAPSALTRRWLALALLIAAPVVELQAVRADPAEDESSSVHTDPVAEAAAQADRPAEPIFSDKVTVTAARLPDDSDSRGVPAHVTVIGAAEIANSGFVTLQDLLALQTGAVVYDQVGNDIQKTFDMRGFTQGSGTRVYLDGAPLNDIRNNTLSLELVPLAALDRIEITRGSAAALAGGGSEAGVIHIWTKRGEPLGGSLSLAAGTYETVRYGGEIHGTAGLFDFRVSGTAEETDGFRENSGGDIRRLAGGAGVGLGGDRRLELSLVDSRTDLGNPGAVTVEEYDEDSSLAPFNRLDYSEDRLDQASLNFRGTLIGDFSLAANLFARERENEILSTGRSAAVFGGFLLDSEGVAVGSTLQVTHNHRSGPVENQLTFGLEWLNGETEALGYFTPADDPGRVDRTDPDSKNTTGRQTFSVFVREHWRPLRTWSFQVGLRLDDDRVDYSDALDPGSSDSRTFSELSVRAGANWNPTPSYGFYASYGEGFLPPTAEELFAFPLFFSNPELRPEDSQTFEIGFRGRWTRGLNLDLALFRIETDDEIIFVPDPPPAFTGQNENVGSTRRQGLELGLRGRIAPQLDFFANATLTDAEFRNGPNEGNEVPLVPGQRYAAGLTWGLPAGLTLVAQGLYVGEQVLDNDNGNELPKLEAYTVVDVRLLWSVETATSQATGKRDRGPRLFVEARNVLDEKFATRGIFVGEIFLTPAPGRRYMAGAQWVF